MPARCSNGQRRAVPDTVAERSAPEHVEGMQGAELIVAVNTDPGAAICNVACYGVAAELFDVVDELTDQLS